MSSCKCDMEFRKCLNRAYRKWDQGTAGIHALVLVFSDVVYGEEGVAIANIEEIYFRNTEKCILQHYPWTKCLDWEIPKDKTDKIKRCRVFSLDKTKQKKFQLFDLPFAIGDGKRATPREDNENSSGYMLEDLI